MLEKKTPPENTSFTDDLNKIYKWDRDWLETMTYYTPEFYNGFSKLSADVLSKGVISQKIKELILASVYASQGYFDGGVVHMRNAINLGITDCEIAEMLASLVLSRGPRAYVEGLRIWKAAGGNPGKVDELVRLSEQSSDQAKILEYFENYYGSALPHIRVLTDNKRFGILEGYYQMRAFCINDGALPRQYKEFLYIAINIADMRPEIASIHVKGAYAAGISKEAVLETMLLGIMAGGMAAWMYAAKVYEDTLM